MCVCVCEFVCVCWLSLTLKSQDLQRQSSTLPSEVGRCMVCESPMAFWPPKNASDQTRRVFFSGWVAIFSNQTVCELSDDLYIFDSFGSMTCWKNTWTRGFRASVFFAYVLVCFSRFRSSKRLGRRLGAEFFCLCFRWDTDWMHLDPGIKPVEIREEPKKRRLLPFFSGGNLEVLDTIGGEDGFFLVGVNTGMKNMISYCFWKPDVWDLELLRYSIKNRRASARFTRGTFPEDEMAKRIKTKCSLPSYSYLQAVAFCLGFY